MFGADRGLDVALTFAPGLLRGVDGNGGGQLAELPRGTVTFVFTDLVVSTRLWELEQAEMSSALARHDEILRAAIAAHEGQVVKGRGDGVHTVFVTADDAVRASIEFQRLLGAESWPVSEPLRVRVGVHTGVAELRDGDYFGSAVNRVARLEGIAHGGQIVVSQATEALVRDGLGDGVDLGKTRLALQVAAEVLHRFGDGVWLCELGATNDADLVGQVLMRALGVQPRPGRSLVESVCDFLAGKQA